MSANTARPSEAAVLRAEQRSPRTYMYAMLGLAVVGFAVYSITRVSATQFDGVSRSSTRERPSSPRALAVAAVRPPEPDTPTGRLALENLYALFRSLMIPGVIVVGVVTNTVKVIDYLITREGQ